MARKNAQQLFEEMDAKHTAFAREVGDQLQALVLGNGFRRVAPPDDDTSPGQVGDFATDNEYAYFYLGNGTTHKWGQSLLITQFIR